MTNKEIIQAIKNQDRSVERLFYEANKSYCIRYAVKHFFWKTAKGETIKCKQEDAEELYNDACVLFIQNVGRNRIENLEVKLTTYLINTMKYQWFNKARSLKPKIESPEVDKTSLEIPEKTQEVRRFQVRKAINQLDLKCREMMTYRYILGWEDYNDIAEATGKNNGDVVRNLISRCRKKFREHYLELSKFSSI